MINSEELNVLISDFIIFLRKKKHTSVKKIMEDTGMNRVAVNDLEKKRRKTITDNVYNSFKTAYGELFEEFEKEFNSKDDKIIIDKDEFEQLKSAIVDMAKEMISLQKKNRKLKKEIKRLKDQ